jgi:o-succinylbenzoate synthase
MDDQESIQFYQEITWSYSKYRLQFCKPAKTSRDTLTERLIFILKASSNNLPDISGIGECAPIYGLSVEPAAEIESMVQAAIDGLNQRTIQKPSDISSPAIRFAVESAWLDLIHGGKRLIVNQKNNSIPINGLVWMNEKEAMLNEAFEKIANGYSVIKLKIGGLNFDDELSILHTLRQKYENRIIIRLDANGAFSFETAMEKLNALAEFDIHSIEQPIKSGQWDAMRMLCESSPIPIALDEELIGVEKKEEKIALLDTIRPQYIILKPTLHGGLSGSDEWIRLAQERDIQWWATSALESNIGLNVIAQWVQKWNPQLPQGLGTGGLYINNFPAAWQTSAGQLNFISTTDLSAIEF